MREIIFFELSTKLGTEIGGLKVNNFHSFFREIKFIGTSLWIFSCNEKGACYEK